MRALILLLMPAVCWAQHCPANFTAKRHALVIGNSAYSKLPRIAAAVQEARKMDAALTDAGFQVDRVEDAPLTDLLTREKTFIGRIQPGDIVFFYYSGYIVQGDDGYNYMLPTNYDTSAAVTDGTFVVERFLDDLGPSRSGLKILMVEGPRPISIPLKGTSAIGLSGPDLRDRGDIVFGMAARQGETLPSPPGQQIGFFTKAVIEQLGKPGLRPSEVFEQSREQVTRDTKLSQIPFIDRAILNTEFCYLPEITKVEPAVPPPPPPIVIVDTVPTNSRDREEYVYIKQGKFNMGCVPADKRCAKDENPRHEVTISKGFWLGRTEVEVNAYSGFVGKKMPPSPAYNNGWKQTNLPIVDVTWDQAESFCHWSGGRLPTEAEWEYAARAGIPDQVYPLDGENGREKANFSGTKGNDRYEFAAPVHSFDANGFNLFDMAGNVWEWVEDFYGSYEDGPATDPHGPKMGKDHVIRGGSFASDWQEHLRLSVRRSQGGFANHVGFRCVLEDTEATKKMLKRP